MASSRVEIASSAPFGYVLKDRNRHDRYWTRESNAFQKNLKDLVQTHLNSCISGSNGNLNHHIDYTDLWVHNPPSPSNGSNQHSCNSDDRRISCHSDSNENSPHTDLWVHNPQRNNNENNQKRSIAGKNWDKARDMVFAFERKSQDGGSSGPVSTSQRGRSKNAASLIPVATSQSRRSPDSPLSGPVSTSQRGRNQEVVSPRPVPLSHRGKSQEGISSGHDLRYQRENSPVQSESSVEVPNLGGVSSLVQKWRDFENEARCHSATNSPVCSSRTNSGLFFADNSSFADAALRGSDACEEIVDLRPATPAKSEDLFLDWESDQTGLSGPPSSRVRSSDATESERTRVADIIRKLTSNGEDNNDREHTVSHESLPRVRTSLNKPEYRSFSPVSSSPRIRGRKAFTDLLMQMERDRHRELEGLLDSKAVSKFSYRGRIQAMLRLRFLCRGAERKDGRHMNSTLSDSNRLTQSAITHIRERFNSGIEHCGTNLRSQEAEVIVKTGEGDSTVHQERKENYQQEITEQTKPPKAMVDNNVDAEEPIRENPVVDINYQEPNTTVHQNALQVRTPEIFHQEAISSSDVIHQGTSSETSNRGRAECTVIVTSPINIGTHRYLELEESNIQHLLGSSNGFINSIAETHRDWEEEEDTHQHLIVSDCSQLSDVSHPFSEWEELQDDYQQQVEDNQDWISYVSRPRSTWEDLRQARYQEMLDPFLENDDIRQLLNRKSVSNFLSSGLREAIDRLMMSRTQQQPNPLANQIKEEEKRNLRQDGEEENKFGMQEEEQNELEGVGEEKEEEECGNQSSDSQEDDIQLEQEHSESQDYAEQTTSWDHNQDHEVSNNYFDPAAFPNPQQSLSSNSYSQETRPSSSFTNHPSIEMEFIYELRGNMEQLHNEISELKRSIKSCINMQMKLQDSITQEATSPSCHSGRKKQRDSSLSKKSGRGRCCICYEMQIDSLLYRCGHMCTCFKCAHDLQWSSGKCPICQAPIIDVVRAYDYS